MWARFQSLGFATIIFHLCNPPRCFSSALSFPQINYQANTISRTGIIHNMAVSTTTTSTTDENKNEQEEKTINVLALHGSGGSAEEFPPRLDNLKQALKQTYNINLVIHAIQAPYEKGDGYSWWTMPPGVRSFTAEKYEGFETSQKKVLDVWTVGSTTEFDLVLGHSQGAILAASLIALGKAPYHPRKGYILNGCAYCNPYSSQVQSLKIEEGEFVPRVLFIMGVNDKINPNSSGEELRDEFQRAGINCSTIQHPKGHGFPQDKDHFMQLIAEWIAQP